MLAAPLAAAGQVAIPGVTGSLGPKANIDKFYSDTNKLLVKTGDGIDHLRDATKGSRVHGSQSLAGLQPGTTVVVHYTVKGIQASAGEIDRIGQAGVKPNEGTVTSIDRSRHTIAIAFSDGNSQTLRLRQATVESEGHVRHGDRVVVYSSDESGQTVARYFKPVRP
jgi:hypothetical protein